MRRVGSLTSRELGRPVCKKMECAILKVGSRQVRQMENSEKWSVRPTLKECRGVVFNLSFTVGASVPFANLRFGIERATIGLIRFVT